MTISSSMIAGLSGLTSNASRLATLSDNIANSSTYGYKRLETDFYSMVIDSEDTVRYTAGGVRTTNQRMIDERGSLIATDNATDLAVRGDGFLAVSYAADVKSNPPQSSGLLLTTTGSFRRDEDGYLQSQNGHILMGWRANEDGTIPNHPRDMLGSLEPIQIDTAKFNGTPTTEASIRLNLPASDTVEGNVGQPRELSFQYYNNVGGSESIVMTFTPQDPTTAAPHTWHLEIADSASDFDIVGEYALAFNSDADNGGSLGSVTVGDSGMSYDPLTGKIGVVTAWGPLDIDIGLLNSNDAISQLSDTFSTTNVTKNGYTLGEMTGLDVDDNGYVRALFDVGTSHVLYQVPLAEIPHINGLLTLDSQTYTTTPDSGEFYLRDAGDGTVGTIASYAREESTADIATELTALITTQRAYASNAKVIQTADEMLQEATNLKR